MKTDTTYSSLDDRHEIFNLYVSQCAKCTHFKEDYTCLAFPRGIPNKLLEGSKQHNLPLKGQAGNATFKKKS